MPTNMLWKNIKIYSDTESYFMSLHNTKLAIAFTSYFWVLFESRPALYFCIVNLLPTIKCIIFDSVSKILFIYFIANNNNNN